MGKTPSKLAYCKIFFFPTLIKLSKIISHFLQYLLEVGSDDSCRIIETIFFRNTTQREAIIALIPPPSIPQQRIVMSSMRLKRRKRKVLWRMTPFRLICCNNHLGALKSVTRVPIRISRQISSFCDDTERISFCNNSEDMCVFHSNEEVDRRSCLTFFCMAPGRQSFQTKENYLSVKQKHLSQEEVMERMKI